MRRVPTRLLADQSGPLQQPQVARDRRSTDRQRVGELLDGPAARAEQLHDGPAVRVAERVERVPLPEPVPPSSCRPHPVVLGVVGELDQAERLEQRRHVDAEPAAEALLEAVPATQRVVGRATPRLDASPRVPVFCSSAPPSGIQSPCSLEHLVEVVDRAGVVQQPGARRPGRRSPADRPRRRATSGTRTSRAAS